jgi:hypothetical protein
MPVRANRSAESAEGAARLDVNKRLLHVMSSVFWDITPYSPMKVNQDFREMYRFHLQGRTLLSTCFTLVSCLAYFSTLKMEAKCSSETSVDFKRITRCCTPENKTPHNHRCENFKS